MSEIRYKYKIAELLAKLPVKENRAKRKRLREALGMSFVVFSRHLYSVEGESLDFKGSELLKIATELGVSVNDLYAFKDIKEVEKTTA